MPRRQDIKKILVVGSGPIVIGQACEFDYSGTQAVKSLRAEGYQVVLVNSNPATIMTDPALSEQTYIEPLTVASLEAIIIAEKPDAILPTVGGQTALNLTLDASKAGVFERHNVEVVGASPEAIFIAEDREAFRTAMAEIDLEVAKSSVIQTLREARSFAEGSGFPVVVRPSFTLGGSGGGIAYNMQELHEIVARGIDLSPVSEVLVEESLLGWKEFELEVMRDSNDNVVIICSIENVDPMGVHTGDSITVAPAQTLTDVEYQRMRNAAVAILRKVGVATGGSNVQFAVDPKSGRLIVIEMNPRVSRSSALASKATGFPIAKIAAKLAVGLTLDEIPNDITQKTPAAFEPALDYVVTKIPKFAFEKFPGSSGTLSTQMKSVGEVMAIGRTFRESMFKALRSLEAVSPFRIGPDHPQDALERLLSTPSEHRLRAVVAALEKGMGVASVSRLSQMDPWFVDQIADVAKLQASLRNRELASLAHDELLQAKKYGFSDRRIADLTGSDRIAVRTRRQDLGIRPVFKRVDTCAAEFESHTPYLYSAYEEEDEADISENRRKVIILGSGPNRIGQGIEFDYCCCHAAFALQDENVESIMINCNPETVSTDYDTSDRLYFEPLTFEDVMEIVAREEPEGVIVQFGGQTPLNLTSVLASQNVPILGTSPESLDLCEDREQFNAFLDARKIRYPKHAFAHSVAEARDHAEALGYPVLVRPSFVLGGRAMAIVHGPAELDAFVVAALAASDRKNPVLIDKYLEDAFEIDVDALCDGTDVVICGILQHIEQAGVHSGDSSCTLPTHKISEKHLKEIKDATRAMALGLKVRGLMNVQFALHEDKLYVLEVNPRASRTVPFVAKATGVPIVKIATWVMLGKSLRSLGYSEDLQVDRFFVKAPVFPFGKFLGADPKLSPEMRSTGEVMGHAKTVGEAYYKALLSAGTELPASGCALITVNSKDREAVLPTAKRLAKLGFRLMATRGTALALKEAGLEVGEVLKQSEGRPNCLDQIRNSDFQIIINTPLGTQSQSDGWAIRTAAIQHRTPIITTLSGAEAAVAAMEAYAEKGGALFADPVSLQGMQSEQVAALSA